MCVITIMALIVGYYIGVVTTVTSDKSKKEDNKVKQYTSTATGSSVKVIDSLDNTTATEEPEKELTIEEIVNREVTSLTMQVEHIEGKKAEKSVRQWDEEGKRYTAYLGYASNKPIKKLKTEETIKGYEYYYNGKTNQVREITKSFKEGTTYTDVFGKKKDFSKEKNRLRDLLKYDWVEVNKTDENVIYACTYKSKTTTRKYKLVVDRKIGRIISFEEEVMSKKEQKSKITETYSGYNTTVIENVK